MVEMKRERDSIMIMLQMMRSRSVYTFCFGIGECVATTDNYWEIITVIVVR